MSRALDGRLGALVPQGYRLEAGQAGSAWAVCSTELEALTRLGFGPDREGSSRASDLVGRAPLAELSLPSGRALLRRFSRGGWIRHLRGGFSDPTRPFAELLVSERLRAAGLPTPQVLFARARQLGGQPLESYALDICTRRIEGATDLSAWLIALSGGEIPAAERQRLLRALGQRLGHWQARGFHHADLTPRNLLVERESLANPQREPAIWFIDLDKSRFDAPLPEAAQIALLTRLWRHIQRRPSLRLGLTRPDLARFLIAFDAGRGPEPAGTPASARPADTAGQPWRRLWRATLLRSRRQGLRHRLGWQLERLLGREPADLG